MSGQCNLSNSCNVSLKSKYYENIYLFRKKILLIMVVLGPEFDSPYNTVFQHYSFIMGV